MRGLAGCLLLVGLVLVAASLVAGLRRRGDVVVLRSAASASAVLGGDPIPEAPRRNCVRGEYLWPENVSSAGIGHSLAGLNYHLRVAQVLGLVPLFAPLRMDHGVGGAANERLGLSLFALPLADWELCPLDSPVRRNVVEWGPRLADAKPERLFPDTRNDTLERSESRERVFAAVASWRARGEGFTVRVVSHPTDARYTLFHYARTGPFVRARYVRAQSRRAASCLSPRSQRALDSEPRASPLRVAFHVREGDISLARTQDNPLRSLRSVPLAFFAHILRLLLAEAEAVSLGPTPRPIHLNVFTDGGSSTAVALDALLERAVALALPLGSSVSVTLTVSTEPDALLVLDALVASDLLVSGRSAFAHLACVLRHPRPCLVCPPALLVLVVSRSAATPSLTFPPLSPPPPLSCACVRVRQYAPWWALEFDGLDHAWSVEATPASERPSTSTPVARDSHVWWLDPSLRDLRSRAELGRRGWWVEVASLRLPAGFRAEWVALLLPREGR